MEWFKNRIMKQDIQKSPTYAKDVKALKHTRFFG